MLGKLVLLVFVSCVAARPEPQRIFGLAGEKDLFPRKDVFGMYDCQNSSYQDGFVLQPVDHFANLTSYWPEFYQYNSKFYNGSSNLVFFMLGADEPINSKAVCKDDMPFLVLAKKYGAAVFQAEHRYFGRSHPTPTLSAANLKWLTPEQILADYNSFIKLMNNKYFGKKQMRWVLFGGSYAGTLVAWMRVKYTNSTIGGIASSSAVDLQVDDYNSAINMQKNYERTSAACASNIGAAFRDIQSMSFSHSGRTQLERIFNLCTGFPSSRKIGPKDLQFFWFNLFNEFQSINQYSGSNYNNLTANDLGLPKACRIMNDAMEPNLVTRVRNVINWANTMSGEPKRCMPNSYGEYITKMSNVSVNQTGVRTAARTRMYQSCSYLGYFTTTDGGYDCGIWGSLIPVDFYVDQCIDMFGPLFNLDYTYAQVEKYVAMFGGAKDYKGSKIVFTNGNMDPEYSLGLLPTNENRAKQVFSTTIDAGTHCSDMYPARPQDSAPLKAARTFIASKLDSFIRSG